MAAAYVAPAGLPRRLQNCSSPSRVSYKLTVKPQWIIFDILSYHEPSQEYEAILDTEVDKDKEYSDPGILIHRLVYIHCDFSNNKCRVTRDGEELNESYDGGMMKLAAEDFRTLCQHNELEYCSIICNTGNNGTAHSNGKARSNLVELFKELNNIKTDFRSLRLVRLNVLDAENVKCFVEKSPGLHTMHLVGAYQRQRSHLDMYTISRMRNWAHVYKFTTKNLMWTASRLNQLAPIFNELHIINIEVKTITRQFIETVESITPHNFLEYRFSSRSNIRSDVFNDGIRMEIPGEGDFSGLCTEKISNTRIRRRVFKKAVELSVIFD